MKGYLDGLPLEALRTLIGVWMLISLMIVIYIADGVIELCEKRRFNRTQKKASILVGEREKGPCEGQFLNPNMKELRPKVLYQISSPLAIVKRLTK